MKFKPLLLAQFAEWSEWDERHGRVRAGLALVTRVGARERGQRTSFKSRLTLSVDYFVAGFFSSTRTTSIGPVPMFSGRCAPAGEKTTSPFFPDTSSLLPSG